jgi:hypothetical protein
MSHFLHLEECLLKILCTSDFIYSFVHSGTLSTLQKMTHLVKKKGKFVIDNYECRSTYKFKDGD